MTGKFPLSLFVWFVIQCFSDVFLCLFSTKVNETKKLLKSKPVDSGTVERSLDKAAGAQSKGLDLMDIGGHKYRVEINVDCGKTLFFKRFFAPEIRHHELFGRKVFPSDKWDWVECFSHEGTELTLATMSFIKSGSIQHWGWVTNQELEPVTSVLKKLDPPLINKEKAVADTLMSAGDMRKGSLDTSSKSSSRKDYGELMMFGECEIPDRFVPNKKYTSFAIVLKLRGGSEKVIPGEGLKDAITESGVRIGDSVSVQRLEQIKVPLFKKKTQEPILNEDGSHKFGDKWVWLIEKRSR